MSPRQTTLQRNTAETQITLGLNLDAYAPPVIETNVPFLSHMLHALATHGQFGLQVTAHGDIEVDPHHLVEDMGIALGQAIRQAMGGLNQGVQRAGCFSFPMDGTLATVALDISGRPGLVWQVAFESAAIGTLDPRLFREFFKGFTDGLRCTLHVHVPVQDNDHHVVESIFKALARSLRQAVTPLSGFDGPLSTKGVLEEG